MSWFGKSEKQKAREKKIEDLLKQGLSSQQALENAAESTMSMAQDVTITLQAKIDDYATQIDSTSRLLTDALLMTDQNGIINSFNPAAEAIFGWKRREITGQRLDKLFDLDLMDKPLDIHFMDALCLKVNDATILTNSVHYEEFHGICKDGTKIFVDVSASKLVRSDKQTFFIILVRDVSHRVRNAQMIAELATKNQDLATAINVSDTGVVMIRPEGTEYTTAFVNKGFEQMVGKGRKDLLNTNIIGLIHDDGGQFAVRRYLKDQNPCRHEIRLDGPDGEVIHADVSITPVFKDRVLQQWVLVFYDTTDLTKATHELTQSEQLFRGFAETSSEALVIHNGEKLIEWNQHLSLITGYSDSELASLAPMDLVHPLERNNVREHIKSELVTYESLIACKSGDVRWVAVNSRFLVRNGEEVRIAVMRDITPYRTVENQLSTMKERYRTVVDNTIDLVCCFDSTFRITFANQTFRDYFDYDIEDITGFSLLDVIPEEDHLKFIDYMQSITPEVDVRRGVHRVQRGIEFRWTDWLDRGVFDNDGELIEIQSVARDITHLIQK